jgi:hypothetical protein
VGQTHHDWLRTGPREEPPRYSLPAWRVSVLRTATSGVVAKSKRRTGRFISSSLKGIVYPRCKGLALARRFHTRFEMDTGCRGRARHAVRAAGPPRARCDAPYHKSEISGPVGTTPLLIPCSGLRAPELYARMNSPTPPTLRNPHGQGAPDSPVESVVPPTAPGDLAGLPEAELVRQAQARDSAAFEVLLQRRLPLFRRRAEELVGHVGGRLMPTVSSLAGSPSRYRISDGGAHDVPPETE